MPLKPKDFRGKTDNNFDTARMKSSRDCPNSAFTFSSLLCQVSRKVQESSDTNLVGSANSGKRFRIRNLGGDFRVATALRHRFGAVAGD